ncbi:hypothetical protein [Bifidobacterium biavatii]|uniref:Uncharacterized protein n=1 Tax=Bifidobacterium biavatii DSM 23969 TaxID=1437608 RepID=A0A087A1H8_9BIFI|nr:hypothetical protein [Bifidobacterium biavatii]KFI52628.1 hypothetical protein BBIA_0309 [Bifidobacterium biavatii DSM 23969]
MNILPEINVSTDTVTARTTSDGVLVEKLTESGADLTKISLESGTYRLSTDCETAYSRVNSITVIANNTDGTYKDTETFRPEQAGTYTFRVIKANKFTVPLTFHPVLERLA